jgi:hypothetical protein
MGKLLLGETWLATLDQNALRMWNSFGCAGASRAWMAQRFSGADAGLQCRAGRWLIPAFHAVIDEGIYDKHDDPQNFEFAVFDENLEKLLDRLRNPPSQLGIFVP